MKRVGHDFALVNIMSTSGAFCSPGPGPRRLSPSSAVRFINFRLADSLSLARPFFLGHRTPALATCAATAADDAAPQLLPQRGWWQ